MARTRTVPSEPQAPAQVAATPQAVEPSSPEPVTLSELAKAKSGEPAGKSAPVTAPRAGLQVRAKQTGIHGNVRRRQGAVFFIHADEKPAKWMEVIAPAAASDDD